MRTQKQKEDESVQLDESLISQFRRYLSEISKVQPLAAVDGPMWWDK